MIEKGRHKRPVFPREERFCPFCPTVENEIHFLTQSSAYKNRNELFNMIAKEVPNFVNLNNKSQYFPNVTRKQTPKFKISTYNT